MLLATTATAQIAAWRTQFGSEPGQPYMQFNFYPFIGLPQFTASASDGAHYSMVNVFDGSSRTLLVRHDASGALSWTKSFDGWAFNSVIEADAEGGVYLSHLDSSACGTLHRINADGEVMWKVSAAEPSGCSHYFTFMVAAGDEVFAVGLTRSTNRLVVARFSGNGERLWTLVRETTPDYVYTITDAAVDSAGSLLVAARYDNPESDFLVVKVNSAGSLLWERTFGPSEWDAPTAIVTGPGDRVTVSGYSSRQLEEFDRALDYLTIQYDAEGNELWQARLERDIWPEFFYYPLSPAIASDSVGDVVLTGTFANDDGAQLILVKYGPTGSEIYRRLVPQFAEGTEVVVDESDRVYVAGPLRIGPVDYQFSSLLIAFDGDGTLLWQHGSAIDGTYPHALQLAGDRLVMSMSRYTSTETSSSQDVLWRGFDADGNSLWESGEPVTGRADWYCGPIDHVTAVRDRPGSCLAQGPSGSVYVGGSSNYDPVYGTFEQRALKLDPAGAIDWTRGFALSDESVDNYGSSALGAAPGGGVRLAGTLWTEVTVGNSTTSVGSTVTVGYDAEGSEQSVHHLAGTEEVVAIDLDSTGASYVLGRSAGYPLDVRLDKVEADGVVAWSRLYAGPGGGHDRALAQLLTPDSRLIYVGQASVEARLDGLARAYDNDGDLLFTSTLASAGGEAALAALAVSGGGIVAAGRSKSATDFDVLVARLDSSGNVDWRRDLDGDSGIEPGDDNANAIAVDPAGNTYAAGRTWNGEDFDVFVVKLDPSGGELWRRIIDIGHGDDEAWSVAFDSPGPGGSAGSLWIAGRASNGNDTDAMTLRLDADGNELFRALVAGTEERNDEHYDLIVGSPGHATVAGVSAEIDESYNMQAIRYVTSPLDVDYDGEASALTDGMLIQRWLFGFRGSVLSGGAVDTSLCERCPAEIIDVHLSAIVKLLDVDGDGAAEALTDGTLIFRWLFGFRGQSLVIGAVDTTHCTRCDPAAIETYLASLAD
jgi:hypothetical protein